jgi:D5 N terminal like
LAGQDARLIAKGHEPIAPSVNTGCSTQVDRSGVMTNPPSDFLKFVGTPFERYILPIIPVGAKLKAVSKISQGQLGKIPGRWLPDERVWVGFTDWSRNYVYAGASSLRAYQRWQTECGMPVSVGMNTKVFNVVDIDSDSPEMADFIEGYAVKYLGQSPAVRLRHGSCRRVLVYEYDQHTAPIRKHRLAFRDASGAEHAVEFLADGQQVVIEGPHAKGQMHHWRSSDLIENRNALGANLINADMVEHLFQALKGWVESTDGLERVTPALPTRGIRGPSFKIGNNSPHVAPNVDLLTRCVRAIDINSDRLADYDEWIRLLVAIKAACGGGRDFFLNVVWPWLEGNADNAGRGIEEMEAKWHSFTDSTLGADYVYQTAAEFGFMEGIDAQVRDIFPDRPAPEIATGNITGAGETSGGANASNSTGTVPGSPVGNASPPPGPITPNDTHRAVAKQFLAQLGREWRWSVEARRWYRYDASGVWKPDQSLICELGDFMAGISRQILSTVTGPTGVQRARNLESTGAIFAVEKLLENEPNLIVYERDFDDQPHLLNTPACVVDLRTGRFLQHAPELLMRQQTLISPNPEAVLPQEALDGDPVALDLHMQRWMPRLR